MPSGFIVRNASDLVLDTTNFDGNLSASDSDVQTAMETLDDATTAPGGSSGDIQYNNASAFGGATGFVYQNANPHVTITAQNAAYGALKLVGAASQSEHLLTCKNAAGDNYPSLYITNKQQLWQGYTAAQLGATNEDPNLIVSRTDENKTTARNNILSWLSINQTTVNSNRQSNLYFLNSLTGTSRAVEVGILGEVRCSNTAVGAELYGSEVSLKVQGAARPLLARGYYSAIEHDTTANPTTYTLFHGQYYGSGSGTPTTAYGLLLDDVSVATTNYAIYTNAGDILLNAGGGQCDFILKGDNYNLIETDSSDDEIWIGNNAASKISFFGATPVAQQSEITDELSTITHTAPGTPDYAIQDLVDSGAGSAFGFATKDEGNSVLAVIANLQARVNELETAMVALGFLADAD